LFKSAEGSQSISSAKPSEDISKSERRLKKMKKSLNLSTSEKAHNKAKEVQSNDWLITTSGCAIHAEERTQNKDKFNALRKAEKVAVYAGTSIEAATSNNIEGERYDTQKIQAIVKIVGTL
jgi:hypothetical protein